MPQKMFAPVIIAPTHWKNEWVIGLVMAGVLLLGEFVGVTRPLERGLEKTVQPLQILSQKITSLIAAPAYYSHSLYKAQRRIQDLEQRYAEASAQLGEMDRLKSENEGLRQMIGANPTTATSRFITTPILSYGHPLVAGGNQAGLRQGQLVIVAQTLVGFISDVSENQSRVELLFQENGQPIVARLESGTQGLVTGDGKRVILTEIPIDAEVKVGERVVTAGQAGIPRDILIGRVVSLESEPHSSTQVAIIDQIVSFYETPLVEIK